MHCYLDAFSGILFVYCKWVLYQILLQIIICTNNRVEKLNSVIGSASSLKGMFQKMSSLKQAYNQRKKTPNPLKIALNNIFKEQLDT